MRVSSIFYVFWSSSYMVCQVEKKKKRSCGGHANPLKIFQKLLFLVCKLLCISRNKEVFVGD